MTYRYNSTIKVKIEPCTRCGHDKPVFKRNKKEGIVLCQDCATIESVQLAEEATKEILAEGLMDIVKRLDEIYSKWLRLSHADSEGKVVCYTCGNRLFWTAAQCGHYKSRAIYRLRWDIRNTRIQDQECNEFKKGNLSVFAKKLELESPGVTEILEEESHLVYRLSRHELNQMVLEYTQKFKALRHATN